MNFSCSTKVEMCGCIAFTLNKVELTPVFHWTSRVPFPVWLRNETQNTQGAWLIACIALVLQFGHFHAKIFHSSSVRSYTQKELDHIWLQQTIFRSWMTNFCLFAWKKRHLIFCIFADTSSTDHILCRFGQLQSFQFVWPVVLCLLSLVQFLLSWPWKYFCAEWLIQEVSVICGSAIICCF